MAYADYELLRIDVKDRVATADIDAPPINLMSLALFAELGRFGAEVGDDASVSVVVLRSANPDFFIAHFDVEAILDFPIDKEAERTPRNAFHEMCERFRTMPKARLPRSRIGWAAAGVSSFRLSTCVSASLARRC